MKQVTKNAFAKLSKLTCGKCETCPGESKHRCCDKMFCDVVDQELRRSGIFHEKPNTAGIPFMGKSGCVVSPHLRPFCTGFVCPPHLKDRSFRREYLRVVEKIERDPAAPRLKELMQKILREEIR